MADKPESKSKPALLAVPPLQLSVAMSSTDQLSKDLNQLDLEKTGLPTPPAVRLLRRRLSVQAGSPSTLPQKLDGAAVTKKDLLESKKLQEPKAGSTPRKQFARVFSRYASVSKVGFVPFNPNKVNQDRSVEIPNFGGAEHKAFFGVFDGHGSSGHEVSAFVSSELPQYFLKQKNLDTQPKASCINAFLQCNASLCKSNNIDTPFSGTTAVVVYLCGKRVFCCNCGDSRAVLGTRVGASKVSALPLSVDHKPDVLEEKKRILDCKGRVEPCKGARGEDIGPPRVWLLSQDVPGLAMTRSLGDQVAASVGVIARPEIIDRTLDENDLFIVLASDGLWEFVSNQEVVDIISKCETPEQACRMLLEEAVRRWQKEEEVIDDITATVVFLGNYDPSGQVMRAEEQQQQHLQHVHAVSSNSQSLQESEKARL